MLQRKLLMRLGLLMAGFVIGAVVAIALLQHVLRDLDSINAQASAVITAQQNLEASITALEGDAAQLRSGASLDTQTVGNHQRRIRDALDALARQSMISQSAATEGAFDRVNMLVQNALTAGPGEDAGLREALASLTSLTQREITARQTGLSRRLRVLIIGLTLSALAMVNISVFVLLRTARMILNPINRLLEGSRELALERFDHRIPVDQTDEFAELARAHNRLADELASNEQKKVQALRHLAVTLSHELNNVINIINLRLEIMGRLSGGDASLSANLREIQDNLNRMARTIASLRNLRRIVLTDYLPGEKMLDLSRSVATDDDTPAPVAAETRARA